MATILGNNPFRFRYSTNSGCVKGRMSEGVLCGLTPFLNLFLLFQSMDSENIRLRKLAYHKTYLKTILVIRMTNHPLHPVKYSQHHLHHTKTTPYYTPYSLVLRFGSYLIGRIISICSIKRYSFKFVY